MAKTNILLETGTNELEIIEFTLDYKTNSGETVSQPFGINVAKVREIIRMPELTTLPNLPRSVVGIFNLRNSIIPALDLCHWLYETENTGEDRKMIVAEFNKLQFGFIVNEVHRIHRFSWTQVEAPTAIHDYSTDSSTVIGIIKADAEKNILMVDVEKIIADINPALGMEHIATTSHNIGEGFTVMTAEDSPTIRRMIVDRLKIVGFDIVHASDGQEAWDRMQEFAERVRGGEKLTDMINLVITDIEMPRMDGHTLVKNIKTNPQLANLPVIIFSSLISDDVRHKGEAVGADAQLTKPQIALLLDTISELLEKYHQPRHATVHA